MGIVITHRQMEFWKRNITAVFGMLVFSIGINCNLILGIGRVVATVNSNKARL